MLFKISFCFLALIVNNLASPSENTGVLSRLYKKAANENRPLIIVLDNSVKDMEETPRAAKPREVNVEIDRNVPLNLLELLHPKHHSLKHETKQLSFDIPLTEQREGESSFKHSDLERLKTRLERERQRRERKVRRERREKQNRAQDYEGQNVNILQDDERNQENRYKKREILQKRLQDRNRDRNQDRYQDRNQDRNQDINQDKEEEKSRANSDKRALRTSVIKNLLRTFNDLNCDAKDECQDECDENYNGKNQDNCADKCEDKYECEETEKEDDPCATNGECDESEESEESQTGSTKGERLVTVTEKCKQC